MLTTKTLSKIILLENNHILSCGEDVANIFNAYFLQDNTCTLTNVETTPENKQENIKNICKQYAQHPSIIKIKERVEIEGTFSLHSVTLQEMDEEIMNLEHNKAIPHNDIPVNVLKVVWIFYPNISRNFLMHLSYIVDFQIS